MSTLRQTIEAHATEFANAIVHALRSASIDELMTITSMRSRGGVTPTRTGRVLRSGRLARRSAEDISRTLSEIVSVLAQHPEGLRAEQIKAALQLEKREMPKPIAVGLKSGALKKTGRKRATVYTVGAVDAAAKARTRK